jgi:hypothetical protein
MGTPTEDEAAVVDRWSPQAAGLGYRRCPGDADRAPTDRVDGRCAEHPEHGAHFLEMGRERRRPDHPTVTNLTAEYI